jgi:hypothetical protein
MSIPVKKPEWINRNLRRRSAYTKTELHAGGIIYKLIAASDFAERTVSCISASCAFHHKSIVTGRRK